MRRWPRISLLAAVCAAAPMLMPCAATVASAAPTCPLAGLAPRAPETALEQASLALESGRADEAQRIFDAEATSAARRGDARRAAFARAGALRATVERGEGVDVEAEARALMAEIDALGEPALAARLRLHVVQSLVRAGVAGQLDADSVSPLVDAALKAIDDSSGAVELAPAIAGNRAEWVGVVLGRPAAALPDARRAVLAAQSREDEGATARWLGLLARLELARGRPDAAVAALRSAVEHVERDRSSAVSRSAAAAAVSARRGEALYAELVDLLLSQASATGDDAKQQALLRETRRHLEARKAAELRDYFRDPCLDAHRRAEPDDIPGTLVVYPVLLPDRFELIASRDGRFHQYRADVGAAELGGIVRRLRIHLENATTRRYLREAGRLHSLLVEPLLPLIEDDATRSVVFVAEGPLRTIPIAALREGMTGPFLIDRVPISVTASLTLTNPGAFDARRSRVLRAGISESVEGFDALPAVRRELDDLGERFQGDVLLDRAFRLEPLREALRTRPYGVVHIASHGEFLDDSRESFLLAWEERITMSDLALAIGETRFRGQGVDLLTLSACQTTAGDDRAALGLAGLAVQSGARSALATLWSINDEAAAVLIEHFYRELQKAGVSRAEALRRAQVAVRSEARWAHPAYWAAFMLIGDWS